ncbi:MAG: YggS family pyridoxal phosphate-dependent enzyme [Bifidobacterium psychraerophilum]|uniref:YggS family pyridoxal phosphate-dependent enzyme n=1 Tax=Bifidobacterium psychraerophilum TaxID=218140 RepID=UPI0039E8C26B
MVAYMEHKDLANERLDPARGIEISDGVHRVLDGIASAADHAGRPADSVRLLAATKTRDVGEIMAAIDAGVRLIGENRPQEIEVKAARLQTLCMQRNLALGFQGQEGEGDTDGIATDGTGAGQPGGIHAEHMGFHLIGQLQSNKINKVLPVVTTVESVDGMVLAERIARRASARGRSVGVLLEVNESGEESKSGCAPEEAEDLAYAMAALEGVELRGLMTIGAHVDDETRIREGFAHLRGLRDLIAASGEDGTGSCRELSMGMTHDMAYAIEEGSTIVRVGTAIFGARAFI